MTWEMNCSLSKDQILELAERYDPEAKYKDYDNLVAEFSGKHSLTMEEFVRIGVWKAGVKATSKYQMNAPQSVEEVTKLSFSLDCDEIRIKLLRCLIGVDYPVASTLLHIAFNPEEYPIIDFRVLWSLYGIPKKPIYYSYKRWDIFRADMRTYSQKLDLPIRTLDKGLWQHSKENQTT